MERSNSKTGFFIGLINCIHVVIIFMNRQLIILPAEDKSIIISAWFIITIVFSITGFFLSKKGYNEERQNTGLGIAGMALNSLVILPAILLLLVVIFSGTTNKRR
jgi:hypothetical protein